MSNKSYKIEIKKEFSDASDLFALQQEIEYIIRRHDTGGEVGMLIFPENSGDCGVIAATMDDDTANDIRQLDEVSNVIELQP